MSCFRRFCCCCCEQPFARAAHTKQSKADNVPLLAKPYDHSDCSSDGGDDGLEMPAEKQREMQNEAQARRAKRKRKRKRKRRKRAKLGQRIVEKPRESYGKRKGRGEAGAGASASASTGNAFTLFSHSLFSSMSSSPQSPSAHEPMSFFAASSSSSSSVSPSPSSPLSPSPVPTAARSSSHPQYVQIATRVAPVPASAPPREVHASAPLPSSESSDDGFRSASAAAAIATYTPRPLTIVRRAVALQAALECIICLETTVAEAAVYQAWENGRTEDGRVLDAVECWQRVPAGIFGALCECDPLTQPVHIACAREWIRSRRTDAASNCRICQLCCKPWVVCAQLQVESCTEQGVDDEVGNEPWRWCVLLAASERDKCYPARRFKPIPAGSSFTLNIEAGYMVSSFPEAADSDQTDAYTRVQVRIGVRALNGERVYIAPRDHVALRGKAWCEYFHKEDEAGTRGRYVPWREIPAIYEDLCHTPATAGASS